MHSIKKTIKTLAIIAGLMAALPAFGMDTYPCDNCHQEKIVLNRRTNYNLKTSANYECLHVLCNECNGDIWELQRPQEDKVWWGCPYCSYFFNQQNKQCWLPKNPNAVEAINDARSIGAARFKSQYPNRVLPDITDATLFPRHPRDPQNINQHPQNPAHQNPNNPLIPGNFVIDNNIKWLGIAGVTSVVCYAAYKTYTWWKDEDKQEKDDEIDEWED